MNEYKLLGWDDSQYVSYESRDMFIRHIFDEVVINILTDDNAKYDEETSILSLFMVERDSETGHEKYLQAVVEPSSLIET